MRAFMVLVAGGVVLAVAGSANAATKTKKHQPVVLRSASGTVIQPTRTIIHNNDGSTTIIVVPRRSYLDPGTDVPLLTAVTWITRFRRTAILASPIGFTGAAFEEGLAAFLGVKKSVLCNSGSSANLLAVSALSSPKLRRPASCTGR